MSQLDIIVDEATLRNCCKTDRLGTTAKDTVDCAKKYGLQAFAATEVTKEQLLNWLIDGNYPIVYLNLFPLDTMWVTHAVVVEAISGDVVTFMDPMVGRRQSLAVVFEQAWQMSKRQVIVISFNGIR